MNFVFGKQKLHLEQIEFQKILNMTVAVFTCYFMILVCGTLGAPK